MKHNFDLSPYKHLCRTWELLAMMLLSALVGFAIGLILMEHPLIKGGSAYLSGDPAHQDPSITIYSWEKGVAVDSLYYVNTAICTNLQSVDSITVKLEP